MIQPKLLFIVQVFILFLQQPCILLLNGQVLGLATTTQSPSCPSNQNTWNRTQIVNSLFSGNEATYRTQTEIFINSLSITNFAGGSFANLPSLTTLSLNDNLLACLLDANLFSTGTNLLKELYLSDNQLASINS